MNSLFNHKGCRGRIILDISPLFQFATPSIRLTSDGIIVGVLEISAKAKNENNHVLLRCAKCGWECSSKSIGKEITGTCGICHQTFAVENLWGSNEISSICTGCKDCITGKAANIPDEIAETLKYLHVGNNIKFTRIVTLLSLPVIS